MKKSFLALIFLAFPFAANGAAILHFDISTSTMPTDGTFAVRALIDADAPLNAYDLTVQFDGPIALRQIVTAHSLISVWQTNPVASGNMIPLRGGSFAPFNSEDGELATFYFVATGSGTASFAFENSAVYAADGKGTKIVPIVRGASFSVAGSASSSAAAITSVAPSSPPQIASLSIVRDPSSGQKILSFLVKDGGSGIAETDVRFRTGFTWGTWQPATNPAPIPSGAWTVGFRAMDNAGNVVEQTVYDGTAFAVFAGGIAGILLGIFIIIFIIIRVRRGRRL